MPRIYDSLGNPHDFCTDDFPTEDDAFQMFGEMGDGPDGRGNCYGYDEAHPDYECDDYYCERCRCELQWSDD